jgi:20S proteasome subunit beta 6
VAGKDFVAIAGDTRLSVGYSILSRNTSKLFKLTDKVVMASSGMYADIVALQKNLSARIEIYRSQHKRDPDLTAIANLLSITLYMRRFFPFYAFNLLAGQKSDGTFAVYGYDAVGSYDEMPYGAQGSGIELVAPVLDNIVGRFKNRGEQISKTSALTLIEEVMGGVANRDIYTGNLYY